MKRSTWLPSCRVINRVGDLIKSAISLSLIYHSIKFSLICSVFSKIFKEKYSRLAEVLKLLSEFVVDVELISKQ
ncbi:UNVERIFIED_CONTAM: hypothetical protein NCL1_11875 [Trichonephila clavipes]